MQKPTQSRAIFLFLMLLLVGRLSYFVEPYGLSVDESTYLSIAEVLQNGGTLYVDAVDRKPPALFWVYQGIGSIFGIWNIHGVHFVFYFFILLLVLLAGRIAFQISRSKSSAFLAAFFFAVFSSCFPREVTGSNAEIPMILCLGGSLLLFISGIHKYRWSFLFCAGILGAVSIMFKQYGFLIFVSYYLAWAIFGYSKDKPSWTMRGIVGGIFLLGGLLVYGSVVLYFWSRGAFSEFQRYFLFDGLNYVADSRAVANHSTSLALVLVGMLASWTVLWWGAFIFLRDMRSPLIVNRGSRWILVAGALSSAVTIFLSGRYYTHYFVPLIWFLSVIAAIGLVELWARKPKLVLTGALLPFFVFAIFNTERDQFYSHWSFSRERQKQMIEVGEWLERHLKVEDRMVVWGMASQLYVMAQRGSGTRFVFADFVAGRQPGYRSEVSVPTPGALQEFLLDMEGNKPYAFVDTSSAKVNDYQWFPPSRIPEVESYLNSNYQLAAKINGFGIFLRNR